MANDVDTAEFLEKLRYWLDANQAHLNEKTRRQAMELVIIDYSEKIRRKERTRTLMKDIALLGGAVAVGVAVLNLFGVQLTW